MAHYDDLDPCDYFSMLSVDRLLAIGWLAKGFEYRRDDPGEAVYAKLKGLLKDPWQPGRFMGWQSCELCRYDGFHSVNNLFVPGQGVTYVAPEGIVHYIAAHDYCPPREFCDAVLSCPNMGSDRYFDRLRSCGWESYFEALSENVERRRTQLMRIEALQLSGDLLISRIEEYRGNDGRLPTRLSELGEVVEEGGRWQYEILGETTAEFLQRIGNALGFCRPPRQTYRLTFIPKLQADAELAWSSEGSRKWVWRGGGTSVWRQTPSSSLSGDIKL
jgi:hypothetical protein